MHIDAQAHVKRVVSMKTKETPIDELRPGDRIKAPKEGKRSDLLDKIPDVLTVSYIDKAKGEVLLQELGGICIKSNTFLVIQIEGEVKPTQTKSQNQMSLF